ncbi:polyprenyl synthetase family protein [Deltaproteobacteria bacterium OttesenSCG-928-K17]|nr:polyprenyl synthetase family protein [Deltaproteobacteria bacterium OttesenSCG-928-K17]
MADIMTSLTPLIERINSVMLELISRDEEVVARISGYGFEGGGKRLRPVMFCLITEALGRPLNQLALETSCSFEFLHLATLLHDDIVDLAEVRRGRMAAHLAFGVPGTVLAGDYLLAKAAGLGAMTGNIDCVKVMSEAARILSLGELVQLGARRRADLPEEEYFQIIYRKTAVLMEGACRTAAILAGADEGTLQAAVDYGRKFGLAFQIVDDVLDYRGDEATFGKPVGHDLEEGKITLPFILAREALAAEPLTGKAERLMELAGAETVDDQARAEIIALVQEGGGIKAALRRAGDLANEAAAALSALAPSAALEKLQALAAFTVDRQW